MIPKQRRKALVIVVDDRSDRLLNSEPSGGDGLGITASSHCSFHAPAVVRDGDRFHRGVSGSVANAVTARTLLAGATGTLHVGST